VKLVHLVGFIMKTFVLFDMNATATAAHCGVLLPAQTLIIASFSNLVLYWTGAVL
jgi:hypothetical protein